MAFARGKYGVEFNPQAPDRESSGLGWVVFAVCLIALVSLGVTFVRRFRADVDEAKIPPPAGETAVAAGAAATNGVAAAAAEESVPPSELPAAKVNVRTRPPKVQNLLLRLEEAERRKDVEMAVSTIEQLRGLPGDVVADLDNALARRLGALNIHRLFTDRSKQWVGEVAVKSGDSATRIAVEHGSTLASLLKLNDLESADRLRIGQKLKVMDHPRFTLVVHRTTKVADLSLNGKFFKRYDVIAPVRAGEGNYETPANLRSFWFDKGISLKPADRAELETLLPPKTPVLISEL